ncbi:hypothetical protein [Sinomonas soli]
MTESMTLPEGQRCTYEAELDVHQTSFMSRCQLRLGHRGGHLAELPGRLALPAGPARKPRAALYPASGTREDLPVRHDASRSDAVQHEKEEIH